MNTRAVDKSTVVHGQSSSPAKPGSVVFGAFRPLLRVAWQLAIIMVYGMLTGGNLALRAVLAVGAAAILASNLVLLSRLNHPGWPKVQQWVLVAESGVSAVLSIFMMLMAIDGPAPLLMLPSSITYVVRFQRDPRQFILVSFTLLVYTLVVAGNLLPHGNPELWPDNWKRWTLISAYGAVLAFGLIMADLIQRHKMERLSFQSATDRMEFQAGQLERTNQQLNEYANRVYTLAAAEERNRIAGEIHDTVAHRLTALLVQLQAARRILQQGDTPTTEGNLMVCEELARESLEEVRSSVRAIRRPSTGEGLLSLKRLALQYASLTGMDVQFEADETMSFLPIPLLAVLYRAIQEGLTNAQRHGRATVVRVSLSRKGPYLELDVHDNGRGQPAPVLGFGLSAMRDRLHQLGGNLVVKSQPGQGFLLRLQLPLWEADGI